MNNGVSQYNNYTDFRITAMRTILNEYNGIIPLELFTYANYPHKLVISSDYNVSLSDCRPWFLGRLKLDQ